jgi:hypothetical protein
MIVELGSCRMEILGIFSDFHVVSYKPCVSPHGVVLFSVHVRFYLSEKTYGDVTFFKIFGYARSAAMFMINRMTGTFMIDTGTERHV